MENQSNTDSLPDTDAKTENTTDGKTNTGSTGAGNSTTTGSTGATTDGTTGTDSIGATTGGVTTDGSAMTGDMTDGTIGEDSIDAVVDGTTSVGATLPGDNVLEDESDVIFDRSLLNAEPMFEFDYKDYHICTYLTYSLIFDGDQVTVRNMQLFVKNGQLFALNAPDEIVPGSILIDTYQGHTYMTVVTQDGKMVDLMDEINYPEDFQNWDIKGISTNLFSNLTYVQVEYENGTVETFNYLTGGVVSIEEGGEEGTASDMDFFSYIMAFFRDKFDTAYAEVSNAYQNAVGMQDFLSTQPWKDWFAKDGKSGTDGTADTLADATFASDSTEDGTAEGQGDGASEIPETDVTEIDAADGEAGEEVSGDGAVGGRTGMDGIESIDGTAADGETGEGGSAGPISEGEVSDQEQEVSSEAQKADPSGMAVDGGTISEDVLTGETSESAESEMSQDAVPEETNGVETEAQDGESTAEDSQVAVTVPTESGFDDELIIAYNADAQGYAVYSAEDLLTEDEEKLVSVDKKMDEYLQNGGELTGTAPQVKSLEVNRHQRNGILIMLVIGVAIAGMLTILAVQKYSRRRK